MHQHANDLALYQRENGDNVLIFGNGYTAQVFVTQHHQLYTNIVTTSRTCHNTQTLLFDANHPLSADIVQAATHVLITIPPIEDRDIVMDCHQHDLINSKTLKWIGYLSSSGVYGDHNGAWIDEDAPLQPTSRRAQYRATVEQQWLNLYHNYNLPVHSFRLSGIYGPGRSVIDNLRKGTARPINKPGHVFNRIHIDDIIQVLWASMKNPRPGRCYNVSDDEPASQVSVMQYGARIKNIPCPPPIDFQDADISLMLKEFFHDCKRLNNNRIKTELGIQLLYPTYKQGLDAL